MNREINSLVRQCQKIRPSYDLDKDIARWESLKTHRFIPASCLKAEKAFWSAKLESLEYLNKADDISIRVFGQSQP